MKNAILLIAGMVLLVSGMAVMAESMSVPTLLLGVLCMGTGISLLSVFRDNPLTFSVLQVVSGFIFAGGLACINYFGTRTGMFIAILCMLPIVVVNHLGKSHGYKLKRRLSN